MKIIKSKAYMKKEAIYSDMPVGDPGLPPGVTEEMISDSGDAKEDIVSNQQGESEIDVNWPEFNQWFIAGGEKIPGELGARVSTSPIGLEYTYSYDYNASQSSDIKAIKLKDYATNQKIIDPYILGSFIDYYEDNIKEDIETTESESKIERSPDYNPFEE